MSKFNTGDIVKRKDGGTFSNGKLTVTVDNSQSHRAPSGCIWLKETDSFLNPEKLELAEPVSREPIELALIEETKKLADLAKQFDAQKKIVDHLTTAKALKGGQANE